MALSKTRRFLTKAEILGVGVFSPLSIIFGLCIFELQSLELGENHLFSGISGIFCKFRIVPDSADWQSHEPHIHNPAKCRPISQFGTVPSHTGCVSESLGPISPLTPSQRSDFILNVYDMDFQKKCEHNPNCEQTHPQLQTNNVLNKWACKQTTFNITNIWTYLKF